MFGGMITRTAADLLDTPLPPPPPPPVAGVSVVVLKEKKIRGGTTISELGLYTSIMYRLTFYKTDQSIIFALSKLFMGLVQQWKYSQLLVKTVGTVY